ncbi:MAG: MIP family channel protein [Clostridium sp.]|nr:MIP family channel protein [Clostridium sp.]MCI7013171.1 MIP family channel protein [Clostridium sp.]MDD7503161.1 MIP family channel protein [Clostridium sp.]MDY5756662.1 MIP family channel protein [Eubacteriales bacterium]
MFNCKKFCAEFLGTMLLVFFGCGVAMTMGVNRLTYVAVALAFGLSIVAIAAFIGDISGCHINPAVSLGMLLDGRMKLGEFFYYIAAQFLGGIAGGGVLALIQRNNPDSLLGSNAFVFANSDATGIHMLGAIVIEIILSFVFVLVVLAVTKKAENGKISSFVIGLSLTLVHLMGLPYTGTSVNPARSFGPALMCAFRGNIVPLQQVWVFIVAPMVGAVIAAIVYRFFFCCCKKETVNTEE